MVRSNRNKSVRLGKGQVQDGGSPAYRLHGDLGLLSGKSLSYSPIPLTVHGKEFSDHIVATSGGGRRRNGSKRARSNSKKGKGNGGTRPRRNKSMTKKAGINSNNRPPLYEDATRNNKQNKSKKFKGNIMIKKIYNNKSKKY